MICFFSGLTGSASTKSPLKSMRTTLPSFSEKSSSSCSPGSLSCTPGALEPVTFLSGSESLSTRWTWRTCATGSLTWTTSGKRRAFWRSSALVLHYTFWLEFITCSTTLPSSSWAGMHLNNNLLVWIQMCSFFSFSSIFLLFLCRLHLPWWAYGPAVGLGAVMLDMPYDIMGIKLVWWTWHDTDPNIYDRMNWVPWNSYYFHASFACSFTWILMYSRSKLVDKEYDWKKWETEWDSSYKRCGFRLPYEILCVVFAGMGAFWLGTIQFALLYHPLHDFFKVALFHFSSSQQYVFRSTLSTPPLPSSQFMPSSSSSLTARTRTPRPEPETRIGSMSLPQPSPSSTCSSWLPSSSQTQLTSSAMGSINRLGLAMRLRKCRLQLVSCSKSKSISVSTTMMRSTLTSTACQEDRHNRYEPALKAQTKIVFSRSPESH